MSFPRRSPARVDVEELERALGPFAGRDVAGAASARRPGTPDTKAYMWRSFLGTISRSFPTRARPVAVTRFSPSAVSGMSVLPVCLPLRDHSVSPWRTMKTRGLVMLPGGDRLHGKSGQHLTILFEWS